MKKVNNFVNMSFGDRCSHILKFELKMFITRRKKKQQAVDSTDHIILQLSVFKQIFCLASMTRCENRSGKNTVTLFMSIVVLYHGVI